MVGCASPRGPAGDPLQERAEGEEPLQRGRLQDALAEVWGLPLCQGQNSEVYFSTSTFQLGSGL
jgi:hypothetical protein